MSSTPGGGNRSSGIPVGYENMTNPEILANAPINENSRHSGHPGHGGSVDYSAHLGRANLVVPTTSPSGGLSDAPKYDFTENLFLKM